MKAACAICGTALVRGAAACPGCGAPVQPFVEITRKGRKWPWILALILLFVLGFLLGRMMAPRCPPCPAPPTAGHGGGGGAGGGGGGGNPQTGAGGKGSPDPGGGGDGGGSGRVLGDGGRTDGSGGGGAAGGGKGTGDMQGGGTSNANGTTVGHGYDGSAVGAPGADDGGDGGNGGKSILGNAPGGPDVDPGAQKAAATGVWRLATGAPMSTDGLDAQQGTGKDNSVKVLSAWDFRYDKTGLPHYPDANQAVLSAMSYDLPGRTDTYGSSSGIITTSAFGDVVDWYRKNLPPGWTATTMGDLNQLGTVTQQFTPDKIMQMLTASADGTPAKPVADIPATAAADRMRISMFAPPAGTQGALGVMVVQKGDKPVEIFMKTHVSP